MNSLSQESQQELQEEQSEESKEEIKKIIELSIKYSESFKHWYNNVDIYSPSALFYTNKYVISPAKMFADAFLDFSHKYINKNDNVSILISKLLEYNHPPYTGDKPNFAINISVLMNYNYYKNRYGEQFLMDLLFLLDQEAFTGVFESLKKNNYKKIEFLYNNVILKNSELRLQDKYTISNSDVYHAIEEANISKKPRKYYNVNARGISKTQKVKKQKKRKTQKNKINKINKKMKTKKIKR